MSLSISRRLLDFATVHPNDRIAAQIERAGKEEPPNTELGRPTSLGLPKLSDLGHDLLETPPMTRWFVLTRPFLMAAFYAVLFTIGWWPVAILVTPLVYMTAGAALHDLLHHSLGVSPRLHGILLFLIGGLVLESGHTLQATHQVHHRKLHTAIDPEGYVDRYGHLRTLGEGPLYKHYLACWVMRNRPHLRPWVVVEALWAQGVIVLALVVGWQIPVFGVYIALTVFGSWIFPYVGVKMVHNDPGDDVLQGTRTLRGALVNRLSCGLSFHLEHHLYPRVPGHKLHTLSQRLDGRFEKLNVTPTKTL